MAEFLRGSSSYVRMEVHIEFTVKYRHKVFDYEQVRERCAQIFTEVAASIQIEVVEMGFDRDHVHMVIQIRAKHSLEQIAKCLKGTSGRLLLAEFPDIKKRFFWDSGLWSGAIYGDGLGKEPGYMHVYVRNQGKKNPVQSLEKFLNSNSTSL
jgi:putative transposase